MAGQYKENWKRLTNQLPQSNSSQDDKDIIRFDDLTVYSGILSSQELLVNHIHYDITSVAPSPHQEGVSYWNADDHTINLMTDVSGTTIQVGQESVLRAVNKTGSGLTNGQVVFIDGAQGNRPSIQLASATDHTTAAVTVGIVTANVSNNQIGYVTTFGLVRDIDTSHIPEGSGIFLSTTPGEFQADIPESPNAETYLGVCVRSHASVGTMFVKVVDTPGLHEIHDITLTNVQHGDVLAYSSVSGVWNNSSTVSISGLAVGFMGADPIVRPEVTGSRGTGAALQSLLSALDTLGLITDSSTA